MYTVIMCVLTIKNGIFKIDVYEGIPESIL